MNNRCLPTQAETWNGPFGEGDEEEKTDKKNARVVKVLIIILTSNDLLKECHVFYKHYYAQGGDHYDNMPMAMMMKIRTDHVAEKKKK